MSIVVGVKKGGHITFEVLLAIQRFYEVVRYTKII